MFLNLSTEEISYPLRHVFALSFDGSFALVRCRNGAKVYKVLVVFCVLISFRTHFDFLMLRRLKAVWRLIFTLNDKTVWLPVSTGAPPKIKVLVLLVTPMEVLDGFVCFIWLKCLHSGGWFWAQTCNFYPLFSCCDLLIPVNRENAMLWVLEVSMLISGEITWQEIVDQTKAKGSILGYQKRELG